MTSTPSVAELSGELRRESQLLEALGFRLWSLRAILAGESPGSTAAALADVDDTQRQLRRVELRRAMLVSDLATRHDLPPDASLRDLVDAIEEPWASRLSALGESLTATVTQIDVLSADAASLLTADSDDGRTENGLANLSVSQAVPRSLVWFLRLQAGNRTVGGF